MSSRGIVIYSDGGCRPTNPGNAGWGIHGYMFEAAKPKKGSGNGDHALTVNGYVNKSEAAETEVTIEEVKLLKDILSKEDFKDWLQTLKRTRLVEVTPVHYIDGFGSFAQFETNNMAELTGATHALIHAADYDVSFVRIITDSEYVRNGANEWCHGWVRNGWIKSNGEPVGNQEQWKKFLAAREVLIQRGVIVEVDWIKGHAGFLGNVLADRGANIGVRHSMLSIPKAGGSFKVDITVTTADGYWKYDAEKHPFISNRRIYFNSLSELAVPGEYYLGEHGKDDELLGKRIADGAFSVVRLKEPDPAIEMLRNHVVGLAAGTDRIMMGRLDHLFSARTHSELMKHGTFSFIQPNQHRLDLFGLDSMDQEQTRQEPLAKELTPARLAMRAVDAVTEMTMRLDQFLAGDATIAVTDLSSILYETTIKTDKKGKETKEVKLKPEFGVGYAALNVETSYKGETAVVAVPVTLTLGIDLLDRNALKRLESLSPKVSLITWNETPGVFRYATVIEAGEDKGIWAGVYSNQRFVNV